MRDLPTVDALREELAHSYTPNGVATWSTRPHPQLDGQRPADLLADTAQHERLRRVARGSWDTTAT